MWGITQRVYSGTRRTAGHGSVTECLDLRRAPRARQRAISPRTGRCMAGRRRAQRSGDPRVPAPSRARRSASDPRRGPLLLTALVVGGLVAGVTGVSNASDAPTGQTSVLAAQMELATAGDDVETLPMASITVAEAEARLAEDRKSVV